jgi:hypothetical protein
MGEESSGHGRVTGERHGLLALHCDAKRMFCRLRTAPLVYSHQVERKKPIPKMPSMYLKTRNKPAKGICRGLGSKSFLESSEPRK